MIKMNYKILVLLVLIVATFVPVIRAGCFSASPCWNEDKRGCNGCCLDKGYRYGDYGPRKGLIHFSSKKWRLDECVCH